MRKMLLLICLVPLLTMAQDTDKALQKQINALVQGFHGEVGIYIKNLRTGKVAAFQADTLFPTASMIKVSILTGIMDKIQSGALNYHQVLTYKDSLLYPGVDILGSFKDGEKIELSKLMMLMITMSDNTASLWLQSLAGGGERINQILDSLGLKNYRVNARTPGRRTNQATYGWGQTTPKDMVTLFDMIHQGLVISPEASERMLRLLGRDYWDEEAISQIPPDVLVAGKSGSVDESRSETLLVMAPNNPYIFSIITNHQTDTTWAPSNEGWVLARGLSRLLWNYFEPQSNWEPSQAIKPE